MVPTVVMAVAWVIDTVLFFHTGVGLVLSEACGGARPWRLRKPRFTQCTVGMVSLCVVA